MDGFWQISFDLGDLDPDRVEDSCLELGAVSVTFVDAHDDPVLEPAPGEFRLWPSTRMRVLFAQTEEPSQLLAALRGALQVPEAVIQAEFIADRAWEREWLRDFHAMRFGQRLWVCPHHESVTEPGAVVVRMDPGLAFGTGTHPSTALCLKWLDAHVTAGATVIDFGCGSGVLAIAAVLLGAREAQCYDIDPQALTATRGNAATNEVGREVIVCETADNLPRGVDILMANILSGPLCELAALFSSLVQAGGQVLVAGLLEQQVPEVTRAYSAWFDMHPFEFREGWAALAGKRNNHALRG